MRRLPFLVAAAVLLVATAPAGAQPAAPPGGLSGVPTDALLFITADVGKLWDKPGFKPLRAWFEAQKVGPSDEVFGLGAEQIDRVTLVVPSAGRDAMPLVLVTTKKPYNEARVLKALAVDGDGRGRGERLGSVVRIDNNAFRAMLFVDERTLLFLPDRVREDGAGLLALVGQLMARKADGPLAGALALAPKHDLVMGLDARPLAGLLRLEGDREFGPYLALLKARTVTLTADFDKVGTGTLTATFGDAAEAKRAAPVLKEGMSALAETLSKEEGPRRDRMEPLPRFLFESFLTILKDTTVTADGANVVAKVELSYQDAVAKFAKALPAYGQAVNSRRGMNNLKQLGLAMHSYHDANNALPSDVVPFGAPGKQNAMSWRVQILPYVEQDNLYRQLDMTKPWDDPANLKRLEAMEMPKVFEIPGRPAPKGHTYFRVFTYPKNAKGTERPIFTEGQRGGTLVAITDGTSNTFMIVEAGEAVPWYKPDVLAYDGKLPLPQLGDKDSDGFLALFGDGSVRMMRKRQLPERTLRALITASGGEVVDIP